MLSPFLYILVLKFLANKIRQEKKINKGIRVGKEKNKMIFIHHDIIMVADNKKESHNKLLTFDTISKIFGYKNQCTIII